MNDDIFESMYMRYTKYNLLKHRNAFTRRQRVKLTVQGHNRTRPTQKLKNIVVPVIINVVAASVAVPLGYRTSIGPGSNLQDPPPDYSAKVLKYRS